MTRLTLKSYNVSSMKGQCATYIINWLRKKCIEEICFKILFILQFEKFSYLFDNTIFIYQKPNLVTSISGWTLPSIFTEYGETMWQCEWKFDETKRKYIIILYHFENILTWNTNMIRVLPIMHVAAFLWVFLHFQSWRKRVILEYVLNDIWSMAHFCYKLIFILAYDG